MWWIPLALAEEPDPEVVPPAPPEPGAALLWLGFRHFWERHAAVGLHMPHRVSRFESRVGEAVHHPGEDGLVTDATFTFAQSPGVDGDWMFPEGYVGRVSSPDLRVVTGVEAVRFEDSRVSGEHPAALVQAHPVIRVPRREPGGTAVAVLQGLSFRSWCVGEGDGCRSDGIWPYRFRVRLAPCEEVEGELACPLTVEVGRAWTPSRGGLRGIEEKPLAPDLGMEVAVAWAVLSTPPDAMLALPWVFENALPSSRDQILDPQVARVDGLPTGFPTAAVALTGLAFELFPPSRREARQERGRYIGGWGTEVGVEDWDPTTGSLGVRHAGGIWFPSTVRSTGVAVEVDLALLLFAHEDAEATAAVVANGALCSPSKGAPWFSDWDGCAEVVGAAERTEQQVPVTIGR